MKYREGLTRRNFITYTSSTFACLSLGSLTYGCAGSSDAPKPQPQPVAGYPIDSEVYTTLQKTVKLSQSFSAVEAILQKRAATEHNRRESKKGLLSNKEWFPLTKHNFIKKRRLAMKKITISVLLLIVLFGMGVCFAASDIPNLVGTWSVQAEGAVLFKGKAAGPKTHHKGDFSTLKAEAVITRQQGRVLHGTFTSPKATEKFIAVIAMDNKSFYFADEDGFMQGQIMNKDQIEVIYRHSTSADTVVAVGTWKRKK